MTTNDYPRDACGVFGVFRSDQAQDDTYRGLYSLQHRGQESAGIVSTDGDKFYDHKAMGLVAQVFQDNVLKKLLGRNAIGHTRYSTTGASTLQNVQPLSIDCKRGPLVLAHNGNLTNASRLREELTQTGAIFQTSSDSEIMLHLIARSDLPLEQAITKMMERVQGAYSLVIMTTHAIIAVRDPHGIRPLSIGKRGDSWFFASETCAFDTIGATFVRDVAPGEIVIAENEHLRSIQINSTASPSLCVFEFVYFGRPNSILGGKSLYTARVKMGEELAREYPTEADVIVPIPDGGTYVALGYSKATDIPVELAYVRNHYVGRSFINPDQTGRDQTVTLKLSLIPELVKGQDVIIMDDSVVRGTTMKKRVREIRNAGARKVHMLVSCPPHRHPCFYGIDFPDPSKLIAHGRTPEQIKEELGLDSLGYLSEEGLIRAVGKSGICMACFNGRYPVPPENVSLS